VAGTASDSVGAETASTCQPCSANWYAPNQGTATCLPCPTGEISPPASTRCFDINQLLQQTAQLSQTQGGIIRLVGQSDAKAQEVRKKANGAVAKLYLDWATQDVINEAQAIRDQNFCVRYVVGSKVFQRFYHDTHARRAKQTRQ